MLSFKYTNKGLWRSGSAPALQETFKKVLSKFQKSGRPRVRIPPSPINSLGKSLIRKLSSTLAGGTQSGLGA